MSPAEPASAISVRAEPSFIRLVYSFAIDPAEKSGGSLDLVKRRAPSTGWRDRKILYEYVLPHLADHLNASTYGGQREVGHWWRYEGDVPCQWRIALGASRSVELVLNGVELLLFRTGIGMLVLDIDVVSDRLDDWQNVLHRSRFYCLPKPDAGAVDDHDQTRRGLFARRAPAVDPREEDKRFPQGDRLGFGGLVSHLLREAFGDDRWERPSVPGLMTPYSAFFVDWNNASEEDQFAAVYRWRRQLNPAASVVANDHDDLNAELVPYARSMWLAYSVDGGGFFCGDAPQQQFFDHELPEHLRRPYTFGFLLALHQRLALSRFSERIGRAVADSQAERGTSLPAPDAIAGLQDDYLEFLTRCRFVQVLRTANHHSSYQKWERELQVQAFANEVQLELETLVERSRIAEQIDERDRVAQVSKRVNGAVLGFALPSVTLAILAVAYPGGLALWVALLVGLTSAFVGIIVGVVTARYAPYAGQQVNSDHEDRDGRFETVAPGSG